MRETEKRRGNPIGAETAKRIGGGIPRGMRRGIPGGFRDAGRCLREKVGGRTVRRLAGVFCVWLVLAAYSNFAFAKSETIYFLLDRNGGVQKTIVVNSFVSDGKDIVDYGDYAEIQNLSSRSLPTVEGNKIVFKPVDDSVFYYRGVLNHAKNPWKIEIAYFLDGKEIAAEAVPGAKGLFEMHIRVSPDSASDYASAYTLQMQGTLVHGASAVVVENASVVSIGSQYTVASVFLPNQEQTVKIKANIDGNLELGAFTFTGVKASLPVDFDLDGMEAQVGELTDASSKVLGGIVMLENGGEKLQGGISEVREGASHLSGTAAELENGLTEIAAAFSKTLPALNAFPEHTAKMLKSMEEAQAKFVLLREAAERLSAAPDPTIVALSKAYLGQLQMTEQLLEGMKQLQEGQNAVSQAFAATDAGYRQLHASAKRYLDGVRQLNYGISGVYDGFEAYIAGLKSLSEGQKEFVSGVSKAQEMFVKNISSIRGDEVVPGSFVDPGNRTESVTFVMRTEELRKPVEEKVAAPPVPKKSLMGKLMQLFGVEWE